MSITAKILESNDQLFRVLYNGVCDQINQHLTTKIPLLQKQIGGVVKDIILASDECHELLRGDSELVAILGFEVGTAQSKLNAIVNLIADNVSVVLRPFKVRGKSIIGELQVGIIRKGYQDILGLPEAKIEYENGALKWLSWMVEKGNQILVDSHQVLYRSSITLSGSRSGHGLMILANNARIARIPPQFSGTSGNSFLERSFGNNTQFQESIEKVIFNAI